MDYQGIAVRKPRVGTFGQQMSIFDFLDGEPLGKDVFYTLAEERMFRRVLTYYKHPATMQEIRATMKTLVYRYGDTRRNIYIATFRNDGDPDDLGLFVKMNGLTFIYPSGLLTEEKIENGWIHICALSNYFFNSETGEYMNLWDTRFQDEIRSLPKNPPNKSYDYRNESRDLRDLFICKWMGVWEVGRWAMIVDNDRRPKNYPYPSPCELEFRLEDVISYLKGDWKK
jgi:hypothetical protein